MNLETDVTGFVIGAQLIAPQPDARQVKAWATGHGMSAGWSADPDKAYVYKTWKEAFKDLTQGCRGLRMKEIPDSWWVGYSGNDPAFHWDRHIFTVGELMLAQFSDRPEETK